MILMFKRLYNHIHKMPRQVSSFGRFKPLNVAIVPAPLPLSYVIKPKSLACRVFVSRQSITGGKTAHCNLEIQPNLLA